MNDRANLNPPAFSIAAVERDTGLAKDTLRVWEKRYGFPEPLRDDFGERLYPVDQVEKLRVIKRLLDNGHRPGKIIKLPLNDLVALAEISSAGARIEMPADSIDQLRHYMELIKNHREEEFKQIMTRLILSKGLRNFVVDVVAPMNTMVGDAWARGYFEIFEEHLYTETIQVVLRNSIATIPSTGRSPRVLLTTLPNELHGLGLLMAECIFAMEGAHCISLGTQTPIYDIVKASAAHRVDIVALSFSVIQSAPSVLDTVGELIEKLGPGVELWCGGASTALRRRNNHNFKLLESLGDIASELSNWRATKGK